MFALLLGRVFLKLVLQLNLGVLLSDWLEEFALSYLLPGKEQDAVAPIHTDVTSVTSLADTPFERVLSVDESVASLRVLVEHELGIVDLPSED